VRFLKRSQARPLKNYLYISDIKLDALYTQIPQSLAERISAELKLDLKVASLTLKSTDNPEPVRMSKLRVVERYIDSHNRVGTVEDPGPEYFRGALPMQWGWLAGSSTEWNNDPPVVIFRGRQGKIIVTLVGSRRHVLGEMPPEAGPAWSTLPNIMAVIGEHISELPEYRDFIRDVRSKVLLANSEEAAAVFDDPLIGLADITRLAYRSTEQSLEFLAVPLLHSDFDRLQSNQPLGSTELRDVHALLGSPLYVAQAGS
jgi:hypothetical protein